MVLADSLTVPPGVPCTKLSVDGGAAMAWSHGSEQVSAFTMISARVACPAAGIQTPGPGHRCTRMTVNDSYEYFQPPTPAPQACLSYCCVGAYF